LKLLRGKTIGASVILLEIRLCNVKPKPITRSRLITLGGFENEDAF
jgi:hypothetical protein